LTVLDLDVSRQDALALAQLEQLATKRPDDVVVMTRLGQVQEALGKNDDALASFRKASQLAAGAVRPLVGQARITLEKGNVPEAMNLVRKARDVSNNDPAVAFDLGRIAYRAKDFQYSYALLQDALKQQGPTEDAQFALALPAIAIGQLDAAKAALEKVVAANGKLKARAATDLRLISAARSRSVKDLPADLKAQIEADGSGLLGKFVGIRLVAADGRAADAIRGYQQLLADYPQFIPAMKQLSIELVRNPATVGEAEKWARKARETLSSDAELSKVLGEAAFAKKDYRYAADILGTASTSLSDDGNLFLLLAQSHAELKQVAQARTSLNRALALPLSPQEKQTAETLSKSLSE
jgi:predicted Zn-dependent protease